MNATGSTATTTQALGVPLSKRWRFGWIGEIAVMIIIYQLYDLGRDRATGATAAAFANARDIVAAEKTVRELVFITPPKSGWLPNGVSDPIISQVINKFWT